MKAGNQRPPSRKAIFGAVGKLNRGLRFTLSRARQVLQVASNAMRPRQTTTRKLLSSDLLVQMREQFASQTA